MNNRPDLAHLPTPRTPPSACDDLLEDYLEHLVAPLVGIVPFAERKAFRQEAHAHLEGLVCEYMWQGKDRHAATETALREFGEPWKTGQVFLDEWLQGSGAVQPALLIRKATWTAFAWFGMSSMLILLLLEWSFYNPGQDALLPIIWLLAGAAPVVAGALAGVMAGAQAKRGVINAVWPLAVHAFITGLLLQPRYEVLAFAGWVLLFWMPIGCLSATATASWLRQTRRQHFWQIVR